MSEGGSQVKVHRLLLGLYSDQWRLTLQGLEVSQLVFILQGVDGLQLGQLVSQIYQPFIESDSEEDSVEMERFSVSGVAADRICEGEYLLEDDFSQLILSCCIFKFKCHPLSRVSSG